MAGEKNTNSKTDDKSINPKHNKDNGSSMATNGGVIIDNNKTIDTNGGKNGKTNTSNCKVNSQEDTTVKFKDFEGEADLSEVGSKVSGKSKKSRASTNRKNSSSNSNKKGGKVSALNAPTHLGAQESLGVSEQAQDIDAHIQEQSATANRAFVHTGINMLEGRLAPHNLHEDEVWK